MKTIKIFLASSEEMDYDRMAFGNLVRRLDDVYEKRGVRVKLFEWEDYDSAYNDKRKQDEYNEKVRESDIFLALFHKKAGAFTVEEFNKASEAFREKASPKVYTYLKDLKPGEEPTPELEEFKKRLFEEMGHYWCRYDNRDSLHLQFVMQLQLVESSLGDSVQVEDGNVCIDGLKVASMDRLRFAAANEDYVKMSEELASLPEKIEKARIRLEKLPDDEDLQDDLQQKLDRYNKLKEEFAEYQTLLFNTAKRIAQLQGERVTDRMRRAMDAFNDGKVREANIILEEAEADARHNLEDYKQSKEITEQKRQNVINSIEELILKTSTVMADAGIPIEERIDRTDKIYSQAIELAEAVDYDNAKHADLLEKYGEFLQDNASYDNALHYHTLALDIRRKLFGLNHISVASSYNFLANQYHYRGDLSTALEYYLMALGIREQVLGKDNVTTATSYNNIGIIYQDQGNYTKALEYLLESLSIRKRLLGEDHPATATSYDGIGSIYYFKGDYSNALVYISKALAIRERTLGSTHAETAISYNGLGWLLLEQGDYSKSIEYQLKAIDIYLRTKGKYHPFLEPSYRCIGEAYEKQGNWSKTLEYYLLALDVLKNSSKEESSEMSVYIFNIGMLYDKMEDYDKALGFLMNDLRISERLLGPEHKDVLFIKGKIDEIRKKMKTDQ